MAKKFPNIETLKVYQQGGDNEPVKSCPAATTDSDLNLDNRERSITRSNYTKSNSESKCGNCIFFDISRRMKKCMNDKSGNKGYCWDQEFICSKENICDMWEEGGPLKSDESSYMQDENYATEYKQNKSEVEQIQAANQLPTANQPPQQQMPPQGVQQMTAPQGPPPQGPPQVAAPPQQEMQPTYKYGGSLRRAQQQEETQISFKDWVLQDPVNRSGPNAQREYNAFIEGNTIDPTFGTEPSTQSSSVNEESSSTSTILDDNTDIYDANNPNIKERGNTLKDVFPWMTNKGIRRRGRYGKHRDENFIPWEADPTTDFMGLGSISNWFKSVIHDERNLDVDPNKITNREFRRYKKYLREQNPDLSRKEIRKMANQAFPSHGNNRWGKEHYQQFKVTNPFSETRFFDPENPDVLLTHGERQAKLYNEFSQNRVAMYPELYQVSSMDNEGNITYTGDKLLGDLEETEYMPNAVHIVHTDDNKGIKGSWIYSGTNDKGEKEYEFIPFDIENPTRKTTTRSSQQTANDCITEKEKCLGAEPAGTWNADSCTCTYPKPNSESQSEINKDFQKNDVNLDDIEFDADIDAGKQIGGAAPTFAFMRDGGDLRRFQNTSEYNWTDDQLQTWLYLQNEMIRTGAAGSNTDDGVLYNPADIDLANRSTWPGTQFSVADGTYNKMYPWLPDMSTKEGKRAAYNLHRTASEKFPQYTAMPGTFWGADESGGAYPYLNESVSEKSLRTGDFSTYEEALKFLSENPDVDPSLIKIAGQPFTFPTGAAAMDYSNTYNVNPYHLTVGGNKLQNVHYFNNPMWDQEAGKYIWEMEDYIPWDSDNPQYMPPYTGHKGTADLSNLIYDANYQSTIEGLHNEWETAKKKSWMTSGSIDFPSFEQWISETGKMDDYVPDNQIITKENYIDAITSSGNPYFEGAMGGYGGGAIGYNTGNQEFIIGDEQVDNPLFVDYGRNPEMTTLMGWIPGLVGGYAAYRTLAAPALNYLGGLSVPGTSGALTLGNVANAYFAGDAAINTFPNAYRDYKEGDYEGMAGNLALGSLESMGIGNMGLRILPKNFSQFSNINPTFPALNMKGANLLDDLYRTNTKQMPTFSINPWNKQPTQLSSIRDFAKTDFTKLNLNPNLQPSLIKKYGGALPKAQNGAQDVAALYQVNPEQFDYDAGMPKEGAISAYGDVWQGGQWVDATQDQHGFNTPDSDQFGIVGDAFSTDGNVINRNVNFDPDQANPFLGNAVNQMMRSAAADTYNVRRRDIDKNTWNPKEGSINKLYGDVWNDETGWTDQANVTPSFDVTDDFAFKGDDNTLSRGQLRKVRRNKRREDRAIRKGFDSYEDMQNQKAEDKALRKQQREDRRKRWGDTWGERMGNRFRHFMDSKGMQRFANYSKALVEGAGLINTGIEAWQGALENERIGDRTAGAMYGVTPTSALSKGEEDELSGIFQTSDKVIARQDGYVQSGAELPRHQLLGGIFSSTVRDPNKYDWFGGNIGVNTDVNIDDISNSNINQESIIPSANLSAGMNLMSPKIAAIADANYRMNTDQGNVLDISGGIQLDPTRQYEGHWPSDNIRIPFLGYNKWGLNGPVIAPTVSYQQGRQYNQGDGRNYWKANLGLLLHQYPWAGTCGPGGSGWGCDINVDYGTQYSDDPNLSYDASLFYGPVSAGYKSNPQGDYATIGLDIGFKKGGEKEKEKTINIDTDMYYELLAAGAEIEII